MLFVFAADKLVASTYGDILKPFNPVIFSDADTLALHMDQAKVVVIDENAEVAESVEKANPGASILIITDEAADPKDGQWSVLQKPVSAATLRAKVSFLISVAQKGLSLTFETKSYQFDGPTRALFIAGGKEEIRLTEKEAEIIQYLYENKDRIVGKDELLEKIFGYRNGVETHTLETHIYKLRQKGGDTGDELIATTDGGYRLILD